MPYCIVLNLGDYVKERPGEFAFHRHIIRDNPKEFFAIEKYLFYQENATEAFMFVVAKDNKPYTTVWISIHLTLDLNNKQAYMDDMYSERYDNEELVDSGSFLVENEMCDINFLIDTMKCHFLGDIQLTDTNERGQKLTGEEWDKYNQYNEIGKIE